MKNNIKSIIEDLRSRGIVASEIIKKSGVARSQFYEILNGKSIPKLDTAMRICKALDANIGDVFPELKKEGVS